MSLIRKEVYLPDEIVNEIILFFIRSVQDVLIISTTCKQYARVLEKCGFWKNFFEKRYVCEPISQKKKKKGVDYKKLFFEQMKLDLGSDVFETNSESTKTNFSRFIFSHFGGWGRIFGEGISRSSRNHWFRGHFDFVFASQHRWQYSYIKKNYVVFPSDQKIFEVTDNPKNETKEDVFHFDNVFHLKTYSLAIGGSKERKSPSLLNRIDRSGQLQLQSFTTEFFRLFKPKTDARATEIQKKIDEWDKPATNKFLNLVSEKIRNFALDGLLSKNQRLLEEVVKFILDTQDSGHAQQNRPIISYSRLLELRNKACHATNHVVEDEDRLTEDEIISYMLTKTCDQTGWTDTSDNRKWSSIRSDVCDLYFKKREFEEENEERNLRLSRRSRKPQIRVQKTISSEEEWNHNSLEDVDLMKLTKKNKIIFSGCVLVMTKRSSLGRMGGRNDNIHEIRLVVTENQVIIQKNLLFSAFKFGIPLS